MTDFSENRDSKFQENDLNQEDCRLPTLKTWRDLDSDVHRQRGQDWPQRLADIPYRSDGEIGPNHKRQGPRLKPTAYAMTMLQSWRADKASSNNGGLDRMDLSTEQALVHRPASTDLSSPHDGRSPPSVSGSDQSLDKHRGTRRAHCAIGEAEKWLEDQAVRLTSIARKRRVQRLVRLVDRRPFVGWLLSEGWYASRQAANRAHGNGSLDEDVAIAGLRRFGVTPETLVSEYPLRLQALDAAHLAAVEVLTRVQGLDCEEITLLDTSLMVEFAKNEIGMLVPILEANERGQGNIYTQLSDPLLRNTLDEMASRAQCRVHGTTVFAELQAIMNSRLAFLSRVVRAYNTLHIPVLAAMSFVDRLAHDRDFAYGSIGQYFFGQPPDRKREAKLMRLLRKVFASKGKTNRVVRRS